MPSGHHGRRPQGAGGAGGGAPTRRALGSGGLLPTGGGGSGGGRIVGQRGIWDIVGRLSSGGASCFVQFSVR